MLYAMLWTRFTPGICLEVTKAKEQIWLELKWLVWWRRLSFLLILLIIFLSLQPNPVDTSGIALGDKWAHLLAYGGLMGWFGLIVIRAFQWRFALAFIALGVALEFVQGMTGYRNFDYGDMLANALGVGFGYWLCSSRFSNALFFIEYNLRRSP